MTREELIQTPEYWQTLYENECERLGIKPNLIFLKKGSEEELEEYAESVSKSFWSDDMETFDGNPLERDIYYVCQRCYKAGIKTGFRKALVN